MKLVWAVTWKIVAFLILWGALYAPLLVPVANKTEQAGRANSPQVRLYFEAVGAATVVLAAWVMTHFVDKRPFISLGFAPEHFMRDVVIGSGIGSGMMIVSVAILWGAGWAKREAAVELSWSTFALVGIAMIANTVTQEVLVRGYIQQTIQTHAGLAMSAILSAVIFTALHAGAIKGALLPAVNLFAAGVLLGLAYALTGNLWLPIALHFSWNFLQGPVLGLTVSGQSVNSGWRILTLEGPTFLTGGAFGLEGGLIATGTTIFGLLALLLILLPKGG